MSDPMIYYVLRRAIVYDIPLHMSDICPISTYTGLWNI